MTVPTEDENIRFLLKQRFREYIGSHFRSTYNFISFEANQNRVPCNYYNRFRNNNLLESEKPYFSLKTAERVFFEEYQKVNTNGFQR